MTEKEQDNAGAGAKFSKLPMILGIGLALAGGGGGFYAVYSGAFLASDSAVHTADAAGGSDEQAQAGKPAELPDIDYVPIDALVISLGDGATGAHLRFRAQLKVAQRYRAEVESLLPRVVDVLNSYLRALEVSDLADSSALVRLRAQMLRRIQIVTGAERVNDLLIMEFVLN